MRCGKTHSQTFLISFEPKSNTFLLSCGSCDSKFRNDKTLRDLIDNCNVCDKNSQLNECMTEHKWNKHPTQFHEECSQYMLHIDLEDNKNKHFFSRVV